MKEIIKKRAKYEYEFIREYEAGIILSGTEVKSLRGGDANISDAYCLFKDGELYIKSMFIGEYAYGNLNNHETRADRKLLLKRPELRKLEKRVKEKGFSIVPFRVFFSERGFVKIAIALATGKKSYDKSRAIKDRDSKRELARMDKRAGRT